MEAGLRTGSVISLVMALGLAACVPTEDGGSGEGDSAAPQADGDASDNPAPTSFAETAWRVMAEDGARYVTFLDADGTYRDLRNGDSWQEGDWSLAGGPSGQQICLKPNHENGLERCWQPDRMSGDTMVVTGPEGRRIELTRVDYRPVEPEAAEDAE